MKARIIGGCVASLGLFLSERAEAAFVNGIETFDGQVLDSSTWKIRDNSVVIQNDSLILTSALVVTANAVVPVGGGARTQLIVSQVPDISRGAPGTVSVHLTTGTGADLSTDSFGAELYLLLWGGNAHEGSVSALIDHPGGGSGLIVAHIADSEGVIGRLFTFEIDRPNSQQYQFTVLDSGGNVLGSKMLAAESIPGALCIGFSTSSETTATFDNVMITTPEPGSLSVLAAAWLGLLRRRRALCGGAWRWTKRQSIKRYG